MDSTSFSVDFHSRPAHLESYISDSIPHIEIIFGLLYEFDWRQTCEISPIKVNFLSEKISRFDNSSNLRFR